MRHLRNIIAYFLLVFLAIGVASCAEDQLEPSGVKEADEDGMVEISFKVEIPDMGELKTRTITSDFKESTESITNLYVFVFDSRHYTKEYALATPQTLSFASSDTASFTVKLHESTDSVFLHFVGNYDIRQYGALTFGSEGQIIGSALCDPSDANAFSKDTYWQRVALDSLNANSLKNKTISLVRNFLGIQVDFSEQLVERGYTFEGFAVMNVPTVGTVAPYNTITSKFADYSVGDSLDASGNVIQTESLNPTGWQPYDYLYNQKYYGYFPSSAALTNTDASSVTFLSPTTTYYMYEHSGGDLAGDTPTFLLLKISDRYYKVDITYSDPDTYQPVYYNLLRNFIYKVTITDIANTSSTTTGYETPEEAASRPADNNLSTSVEVAKIKKISNGKDIIEVEYTEKVITSSDPVTVKFRYAPDITSPTTYDNSKVQIHLRSDWDNVFSSYSISDSDDDDGYRTVTLTPAADPGIDELVQYVTVYVHYYDSDSTLHSISRNVKYHYVRPYDMTVTMPSYSLDSLTFTLNIKIPDGLNESMFPMGFWIESLYDLIYPNTSKLNGTDCTGAKTYEYMYVETGTSIFPSGTTKYGKQSYGFVKSITYDDYMSSMMDRSDDGFVSFNCYFKFQRPDSGTTKDVIYVSTDCFNLSDELDYFVN
jgi:hypothetical protein